MSTVANPVDIDIQIHTCSSESMQLLNINSGMPILARGTVVVHVEKSKDYTFRLRFNEKTQVLYRAAQDVGLHRTLSII